MFEHDVNTMRCRAATEAAGDEECRGGRSRDTRQHYSRVIYPYWTVAHCSVAHAVLSAASSYRGELVSGLLLAGRGAQCHGYRRQFESRGSHDSEERTDHSELIKAWRFLGRHALWRGQLETASQKSKGRARGARSRPAPSGDVEAGGGR